MSKRLSDRFSISEKVEIYFPQIGEWVLGQVIGFEHPGIWIETRNRQRWFVTNGRRIRPINLTNQSHE